MTPASGPNSGATAEASKKQRPMPEAQTQTLRRARQRSISRTAGICSSCARNGTAASTPMAKLLAPSTTKTDEEDSGSQRPHRFVGERIIEDEAGGPLGHVRARPAETTRIVVDIGVQHCSSSFARGGELARSRLRRAARPL